MATATKSTTTTPAVKEVGDARFRAVRRIKNRFNAAADRNISRYTRAVAASKDPVKAAVNGAKAEAWSNAKALLAELG